jgi:hypothetical protein
MFDSLRKLIKGSPKQEERVLVRSIEDEIEGYDREIEEYLSYVEERKRASGAPPHVSQPEKLGVGGGMVTASLITPEEEKRIKKTRVEN